MIKTTCIAIMAVFASCGMAHAGPVLLASYDFTRGIATAPQTDPRFELILQLPSGDHSGSPGLGIGLNVFWEAGDGGTFDYTPANDDAFADFALHATDGIDDLFTIWMRFPPSAASGHFGTETELFAGSPDLNGSTLELVRLITRDITIEPFTTDPDPGFPVLDGFIYDFEGTYEFYGTPVPEPGTLCLLVVGAGYLLRKDSTH